MKEEKKRERNREDKRERERGRELTRERNSFISPNKLKKLVSVEKW